MRTHYIPQKYLSRFSADPTFPVVWQYDRKEGTFKKLPISAVGVFTDWFSPQTESQLSATEGAAIGPMDKLTGSQGQLDEDERKAVCAYIASMVQRVPPGRKLASELMDKEYEAFKNNPEALYQQTGVSVELAEEHFAQFEVDGTREKIINEDGRLILDLPKVEAALYGMQWMVFLAKRGQHFITSDAPVYWDKTTGIGKTGADLTIPMSSKTVLHLCYGRLNQAIEFRDAGDKVRRQLNRRAVYYSERFIFSSKDDDWVKAVATRKIKPANRLANAIGR